MALRGPDAALAYLFAHPPSAANDTEISERQQCINARIRREIQPECGAITSCKVSHLS